MRIKTRLCRHLFCSTAVHIKACTIKSLKERKKLLLFQRRESKQFHSSARDNTDYTLCLQGKCYHVFTLNIIMFKASRAPFLT